MSEPLAELNQPARRASPPAIPGYEVEAAIGRGATGIVYRARQLAVDREVALKVLHQELTGSRRAISRLQREARTTARLAHPHIVSAIDMGQVDGRWWYAMELVDGPSLALRLRQEGRLPEREALRLFIPLCEALVHTFEHGVVHRDIKPGNILIDKKGGARLADLGLAFADDDPTLTASEGTLGTPVYISPEQARDPTSADIRSDLWSLGATMFHAVCGRPPFVGQSTAEVLSGVLYAPIPDPHRLVPELSKGFVLVLRKCLTRDPARRYRTPAELLADLERVRERRRPKVRAAGLDPLAGRLGVGAWIAAGGGAVVLAAGLSYFRPWSEPVVAAPWEPLVEVAAFASRGGAGLAAALAALENLEPVPPEHVASWLRARKDVRAALGDALVGIRAETWTVLERALVERDFVAARRALGAELNGLLLARTGYSLERLPPDDFPTWLDGLRARVDGALQRTRARVAAELERHIDSELLPRADALALQQRWRDALALVTDDSLSLVAAAGPDASGLPREELESVLASVALRVGRRRQSLLEGWRVADLDLAAWVERFAGRVERELYERSVRGAADVLADAFAGELARLRQPPDQLVPAGLVSAAQGVLERRSHELRELEASLREREAQNGFDVLDTLTTLLDEAQSATYFAERDYAALQSAWEARRGELGELLAGGPESPWKARLDGFCALRIEEAQRLGALLVRAAQGVSALDGQRREVLLGSVRYAGTLRAGADPLANGFELLLDDASSAQGELGGRTRRLSLRDVAPLELLALAGLAEPASSTPADRLLRALFLYRERELARAQEALESGALPSDELDRALVADLRWRLGVTGERQRRLERERVREAQELLARLTPKRVSARDSSLLKIIGVLQRDFADLEPVRAQADWLRALESELLAPAALDPELALRQVYHAYQVEQLAGGRVRLAWDFGLATPEAWRAVGWVRNGAGLEHRDVVPSWDGLAAQDALRLLLRPPLDVDGGRLTLRLELRQDREPPRCLVVSAAGFHAALCGTALPGVQAYAWQVGRGSVADLLGRVRAGDVRRTGALLAKADAGTVYIVELDVDHRRGDCRVAFGKQGEPLRDLGAVPFSKQPDGPDSRSISVRAWERLTISRVVLEGARERR